MKQQPILAMSCWVLGLSVIGACDSEAPAPRRRPSRVVASAAPHAAFTASHPRKTGPTRTRAQAQAPAQTNAPKNNDCWYYEIGASRLLAVWVSPRLEGQVPGGFRFVNLYYHDSEQKAPFSLHSSPVRSLAHSSVTLHG